MTNKILVVDDELPIRESFALILKGKYQLFEAASGEAALKIAADQKLDLVFLDIRMPGLNGLETLKKLKEIDPELEVVMITAINDVQKASEAISLGARDYIVKPFDVENVLKTAENILFRKKIFKEGILLQEEVQKETPKLIGESEKILEINQVAEQISNKDTKVLILGETGVEKETLAQIIHQHSPRAELPFYTFDLSPEFSLSEIKIKLLGLSKGETTFTLKKLDGIFEKARGGTVFLNHAEYLPAEIASSFPAGVWIIAGSTLPEVNEHLKFFSEVVLHIPPLRERVGDIPLLLNFFLDKFKTKYGKEDLEISQETFEILSNYSWPGNTEELETLLEKLTLAADKEIVPKHLPIEILLNAGGSPGSDYLSSFAELTAQGRTRTGTAYSAEGF